MATHIVTAEYEAVEDAEMSIAIGDLLIIGETEAGWSHATHPKSGKSGWIPADFVEPHEAPPPPPPEETSRAAAPPPPPSSNTSNNSSARPAAAASSPPPPPAAAAAVDPKKEVEAATLAALNAIASAQAASGIVDPTKPICHGCKANVFPGQPFITIKERTFHAEHFVCFTCKKSLQGIGVIERDDKFYCKEDFYNEYSKKCGHCELPLIGQYMEALGKAWHPDHFVCSECSKPFASLTFRQHDNRPYCEEDYQRLFGEWCAKCGKPIDEHVVVAMEKKFHADCFVCEDEKHKIGDGEHFYLHFDKVYCPKHFEALFVARCDVCKKELDAGYTKLNGKSYHSHCAPKEEKKAPTQPVYFPFIVLKQNKWPKGAVDITKKEDYLSPEDFQQLFGMTKAQFNALPSWKRKDKKQKVGLF